MRKQEYICKNPHLFVTNLKHAQKQQKQLKKQGIFMFLSK